MRQSRPCGMCCNCEANSWRQKYPRIEYSREQNINTIRGYFSHLLLNNKLPQTEQWKTPLCYYIHWFCESGIQRGHIRDGVSLPYEVWGPGWMVRVTQKNETSSFMCLAPGLSSAGPAAPALGLSMWLELLTLWVSRGNRLRVKIPKGPGRVTWLSALPDNREWPIKKMTNCPVCLAFIYGSWSAGTRV